MIRVLLVAPLDPDVPGNLKFLMGGENTYTRTLMSHSPQGVEYVHHDEALVLGQIEYLPIHKVLNLLVKFRILPLSAGSKCFKLRQKFDLVHCHAYSIKLDDPDVPIILSDSSSNYLFLKYYVHWPEWRIKFGYKLRKWFFDRLRIIDPDVRLGEAKSLIVFSKFGFEMHKKLGQDSRKMVIASPGLPRQHHVVGDKHSFSTDKGGSEINILFVGIWFERKGGPILLEAYRRLVKKYSNLSLTVIGPIPKRIKNEDLRIKQSLRSSSASPDAGLKNYDYVPREKLMREFFPRADIFVIVPPKVEGFGFALLEAMSFGIPVVVSQVCALPELVEDGKTGFVIKPGSVGELVNRLEVLVKNQALRKKMGENARRRFEDKFSIEKSNETLLKIYRQVLP